MTDPKSVCPDCGAEDGSLHDEMCAAQRFDAKNESEQRLARIEELLLKLVQRDNSVSKERDVREVQYRGVGKRLFTIESRLRSAAERLEIDAGAIDRHGKDLVVIFDRLAKLEAQMWPAQTPPIGSKPITEIVKPEVYSLDMLEKANAQVDRATGVVHEHQNLEFGDPLVDDKTGKPFQHEIVKDGYSADGQWWDNKGKIHPRDCERSLTNGAAACNCWHAKLEDRAKVTMGANQFDISVMAGGKVASMTLTEGKPGASFKVTPPHARDIAGDDMRSPDYWAKNYNARHAKPKKAKKRWWFW